MRADVIQEMQDIWNTVAEDLFVNEDGSFNPQKVLKGTQVAEIISDLFAGGRCEDEGVRLWYMGLPHNVRCQIAKEAFPDKCYGY